MSLAQLGRICILVLCATAALTRAADKGETFQTSDRCLACHNGLTTNSGHDVSIGSDWRTSLMANSSRDPYWQASVRRETLDHAGATPAIQDECSVCHMPIVRYTAKTKGQLGTVFEHLPLRVDGDRQASDGVSCSVCHQITPENLGTAASFNGRFIVAGPDAHGAHAEYGPFNIDPGLMQVMRTSTEGFEPRQGDQTRSSELCASCHTLITKALDSKGNEVGSLPEQVPYQEWLHSEYRDKSTCQSCHMPTVHEDAPIARILSPDRQGMARHVFVAANFFMQRVFSRYHDELAAVAPSQDFSAAADRTVGFLQTQTAKVSVSSPRMAGGRLEAEVAVENLSGHKFPTGYPSRRAWLHLVVRDGSRHTIFESGALNPDGSIKGNPNDFDAARYSPHYSEIRNEDQVQIYESILKDPVGAVTTGLLSAVGYLKDNRLLPHGFDKTTTTPEIAVHGEALTDPRFTGEGDRVLYSIDVRSAAGPFEVEAELWYQPIGYRWAKNLQRYESQETSRFGRYFDSEAAASAVKVAEVTAVSR